MKRDRNMRLRKTAARLYLAGRWGLIPLRPEHLGGGSFIYHDYNHVKFPNRDDIPRIRKAKITEINDWLLTTPGVDADRFYIVTTYASTYPECKYRWMKYLYYGDKPIAKQAYYGCDCAPEWWQSLYHPFLGGDMYEGMNCTRLEFLMHGGGVEKLEEWERKCCDRSQKLKQQFNDEIHAWQKRQIDSMVESFGMKRLELRTKYWHIYKRWCQQIDAGQWLAVKHEIPKAAKYAGMNKPQYETRDYSTRQLRALGFVA